MSTDVYIDIFNNKEGPEKIDETIRIGYLSNFLYSDFAALDWLRWYNKMEPILTTNVGATIVKAQQTLIDHIKETMERRPLEVNMQNGCGFYDNIFFIEDDGLDVLDSECIEYDFKELVDKNCEWYVRVD